MEAENICHIVAILPHTGDFLEINKDISEYPYTVLEYGDSHTTTIDKPAFERCGRLMDSITKQEGQNF